MKKAFLTTVVAGRKSVTVNRLIKNRSLHSVIVCDQFDPSVEESDQIVVNVRDPKRSIEQAVQALQDLSHSIDIVGYLNTQDQMSFIYRGILERFCPEHPDIENINVSRDKYTMRCLLNTRKMSQPYFALVNSESALHQVMEACPFPCVSKPPSGSESYLIRKNNSPVELQQSYRELRELFEKGAHSPCLAHPFLLVEQFLPGKDFHVEGMVDNGHIRLLACHEKLSAFPSDNSFSQAVSISPPISLSQADLNKLEESVVQAISILKLNQTMFNVDLRFDGTQATIVEINPRIGGATIRQTILELTGLDAVELHVRLALGEQIDWPARGASAPNTNCLYRIPIPRSGWVSGIRGLNAIKNDLAVYKFALNYQIGDRVTVDENKADNHFGYVHVVSNTPQQALKAMQTLILNLKIDISDVYLSIPSRA